MKKLTVFILTAALLLSTVLCVGMLSASAAGDAPCSTTTDCTGTYQNGFCSVCGGYEVPEQKPDGYYEIDNGGKLYWFAQHVNAGNAAANARLTADITITNSSFGTRYWTPIGSHDNRFSGTLDGQGHTIGDIFCQTSDSSSDTYAALFFVIDEGGTVKNLGMTEAIITGGSKAGSIVGLNYGTVQNCFSTATVQGIERVGKANYFGGLLGFNYGLVENCYYAGVLSAEGGLVGGVAGMNEGTLRNCYYNTTLYSGEAVGWRFSTAVEEDVAGKTAAQLASGEVAYLLGEAFGQTLTGGGTDSYPVFAAQGNKIYRYVVGGICSGDAFGYANEETADTGTLTHDGTPIGEATCTKRATCSTCGEECGELAPDNHTSTEYSNGFRVCCGTYEPAAQAGVGANGQPLYEISNAGQLFWFAEHVNMGEGNEKANAILKADIDLNLGYTFTFISDTGLVEVKQGGVTIAYLGTGIKGDASGENATFDDTASFEGETYANADDAMQGPIELLSGIRVWSPIGSTPYAGSFDGNGKTVGGMYVNSLSNTQGLFAHNKGTVKHVGVVNSCVFGASYTGGIVGHNDGDVMNSYYAGIVIGNSSSNYVGGVAGHNDGIVADSYNTGVISGSFNVGGVVGNNGGDVVNCHNAGAVSVCNGDHSVGGVVGYNDGDVKSSYNVGPVSAGDSSNSVGGVVGYNYGDVEDSYNTGSVRVGNVSSTVGGVVGYNYGDIVNSYNVGAISGGSDSSSVGGMVGYNAYGSVKNSYNEGTVSVGEGSSNLGGVLGHNSDSNVRNVYNKGAVSVGENSSSVGGVVGYNFSDMRNVYNVGAVSIGENSSFVGSVIGKHVDYNYNTVVNMYYLAGTAACGIGNTPEDTSTAIAKTEAEFKNGTVAWLLNDFVGYDVFGQTLSGEQTDASPVILTDSNRIYFGYITCDAAQTAPVYSNVSTATAEKPAHTMADATCTAPAACSVCGHTEGAALGHDMADATCTAPSTCNACSYTEGEALGHSYDNACDAACNICGAERIVGEHLDGDGNSLCDACGAELPKDGIPAGAIVGIVTGTVAAAGLGGFSLFWFAIKKKKWSDLVKIFKK